MLLTVLLHHLPVPALVGMPLELSSFAMLRLDLPWLVSLIINSKTLISFLIGISFRYQWHNHTAHGLQAIRYEYA